MRRALLIVALLAPAMAHANGAFPDSLAILLPREQPQKITLATNFGLIFSADDGRTWEWTCEHGSSLGAIYYQLGPPPHEATYALGLDLVRSTDDGCAWQPAGGRVASGFLYDLFVDPTSGDRVLAVANPNDETPARVHVFESLDGGMTFPSSLYEAELGLDISGLEVPFADPSILYLTWASSKVGMLRSGIIRLRDHGASVETFDHFDTLGGDPLGIATVDRRDARRIFLRAFGNERDRLAISEDGGVTVRVALEVNRSLAGLVQRADGTLFAAARDLNGGTLHVSHDNGKTFEAPLPGPRFRALAERAGRLYAAADEATDGYALAVSDDDGKTWQPILHYRDVVRVKSCAGASIAPACTGTCMRLAFLNLFQPAVCGPASLDAGVDASPDAAAPEPSRSGCGCALGGRRGGGSSAAVLALALAISCRCRRRRPAGPPRSTSCRRRPGCSRSRRC
jgi:hypothetical protein